MLQAREGKGEGMKTAGQDDLKWSFAPFGSSRRGAASSKESHREL